MQARAGGRIFRLHLNGEKRGILDNDPDFFDRRHKKVFAVFAFEHRRKQFDQRRAADRRSEKEPGAVRRDPDIEVAAKGRVP